jgi:uncharacterized membrane protein
MEKLALLKNSSEVLSCNINSALSCSNVLNSHQASVLGPPNALICSLMFCFFAIGLVSLTGSIITAKMRLITQFLVFFTLGFGTWFLEQSNFAIGALCIFCIFNIFALLLINGVWFRLNYADLPISKKLRPTFDKWLKLGADYFVWSLFALLIVLASIIKFT